MCIDTDRSIVTQYLFIDMMNLMLINEKIIINTAHPNSTFVVFLRYYGKFKDKVKFNFI